MKKIKCTCGYKKGDAAMGAHYANCPKVASRDYQVYKTTTHPKGGSTGQPTLAEINKIMTGDK